MLVQRQSSDFCTLTLANAGLKHVDFMFVWVCFIGIPTDQAVYLDGIGVFFVAQVGMKPTKWGDMRSLLALGIIVYTVCI